MRLDIKPNQLLQSAQVYTIFCDFSCIFLVIFHTHHNSANFTLINLALFHESHKLETLKHTYDDINF